MISFFANLFGYVLNFLYEIVKNYGVAIILFSVLVKLIMLPISIKQQKTMKKSQKMNDEVKQIQFKYKNDPEKMNQEVMDLYKREKMSPFSGCFSAIVQLILLLAVFYLVRSPLTYMKKIDSNIIENFETIVSEEGSTSNYKEIAVINYINNLQSEESVSEDTETTEETSEESNEIIEDDEEGENAEIIEEDTTAEESEEEPFDVYEYIDELYINMDFLGLDLSKVPTEDLGDWKVMIIPILYVISSVVSVKLSTNINNKKKDEKDKKLIGDGKEEEYDPMAEANKSMNWMMPIMSILIACIAPLGMALYWLVNNILMIVERLVLNKILVDKEEAKNNA